MDKQSPEMIEREMEQTRASLVEKVAALENQVVGTLQTATCAVQETVTNVKDAVHGTVETVKDTVESVKDSVQSGVGSVTDGVKEVFDVRTHVQNYPWACVGAATLAGFGLGMLLGRKTSAASARGLKSSSLYDTYRHERGPSAPPSSMSAGMASAADSYVEARPQPARTAPPEPSKPGLFDQLFNRFSDELLKIGEEALHTLTRSLKANVSDALPRIIENAVSAGSHAVEGAVGSFTGARPTAGGARGYAERQTGSDQSYRG